MGGNTRAIDRATGDALAFADRIDFKKIDPIAFCREVRDALHELNSEFEDIVGGPIWPWAHTTALIDRGIAFNGTSEHLFGDDPTKLLAVKPTMGDIDITVPQDALVDLYDVLAKIEGKHLTGAVTYLGQNKLEQKGKQINALFQYAYGNNQRVNVQIDFEGVEYVDGLPSEFAKFSHSSDHRDIEAGIKGVAHKYWLTNLVRAVSKLPDALVVTEKSPLPPEPVRIRKERTAPREYAFSVDRGLRQKLVRVALGKKPFTVDGKPVYRELSTADSSYVTDPRKIFQAVFGHPPTGSEMSSFRSFLGLLELSRKYLELEDIRSAFDYMLQENIYGAGAQRLDRNGPEGDAAIKDPIVKQVLAEFPELSDMKDAIARMRVAFYERY